jgi:hypothetical protein
VAEAEAARREGEEKRAALEAELRERTAQLAAAKAARPAPEEKAAAGGATAVPASGGQTATSRTRRAPAAEGAQEPRKPPELIQPARP